MPSPPYSLSSLCRRLCFLLTIILFLLSSARRCASFAASIRCSSWYCASTPPPSFPRSSLEEEARALSVGDELVGETVPLRYGRRLYRLAGLRPPAWYEIKISYPTSVRSGPSHRLKKKKDKEPFSPVSCSFWLLKALLVFIDTVQLLDSPRERS